MTSIYQEKLSEMSQHLSVYQYYCGRALSYMSNDAKRWGMTNIYHTNEILGLVFINHELDSERGEGTLVLYDTNQKILYDTV